MICKYCHLKTHFIDKCPTIICKKCKDIGHPQWLCKNVIDTKNMEKKYQFTDEIKKKQPEYVIEKDINYYLKLQHESWGNLLSD